MKDSQGLCRFKGLVYIPRTLWQEFVWEQYLLLAHGHQGITKTFERIARDYYILRLRTLVEEIVNNCDLYQKTKRSNHVPQGLLQLNKVPNWPWEVVIIDFITKLLLSRELFTRVTYNTI